MTIVRQIGGAWMPTTGVQKLERMVSTFHRVDTYADGRQSVSEVECAPYPVEVTLDIDQVERLVAAGTWDTTDLTPLGLANVEIFVPPAGKIPAGEPTYVERKGRVFEVYQVQDVPPSEVVAEPTPLQKLAAAGLTLEDLRAFVREIAAS